MDAYVKIEGDHLNHVKQKQTALRLEIYQGLLDHLQNETVKSDAHFGKIVILPSSFACGPRAMRQHNQDDMTIVMKFGKPEPFVTFTCNPKWSEIQWNLEYWQSVPPKTRKLMKDI